MQEKIISIKCYEFRDIRKKNKYHEKPDCEHRRIDLHENGNYITCRDCKIQLSEFWALKNMLQAYKDAWRDIEIARKQINELSRKNRFLKSLNMIDKAWRGKRQNAVCCPHCNAPILPEDNLGALQTSAILERKRREKLKQ